jgi:hypothetical protein
MRRNPPRRLWLLAAWGATALLAPPAAGAQNNCGTTARNPRSGGKRYAGSWELKTKPQRLGNYATIRKEGACFFSPGGMGEAPLVGAGT